MKKFFTLLLISVSLFANAQVTWNFTTATPSSGIVANSTVSDVLQGNNNGTTTLITAASPSATYTGASAGNNAGAAARTGAINTAAAGSAYFEFTITPATGYFINITGANTGSRSTGTGPQLITIRSSLDAFAADVSSAAVLANSTWALTTFTAINLSGAIDQPITIRLYGSNGTGGAVAGTANWRIDDLKFTYSSSNVLPISLSNFTGSYTNKASLLKWTSGVETNVSGYAVERSYDGTTFNQIGFVNAIGAAEYSYTDAAAKNNTIFYRLRIDGNQPKYSATIKINTDVTQNKLSLYPTPAHNELNATFFVEEKGMGNIQILDLSGKVLLQKQQQLQQGFNVLNFDVSTLQNAAYIFKIVINNKPQSTVFNKL